MLLPIVISTLLGAAAPASDKFFWEPSENFDRTEECAGWAIAIAEGMDTPSPAVKQTYVSWNSAYAVLAIARGMKPSEIDTRLDASTAKARSLLAKGEGADRIVDCSQAALRINPLSVAWGPLPR